MNTAVQKLARCAVYSSQPAAIALNICALSIVYAFCAARNLHKKPSWERYGKHRPDLVVFDNIMSLIIGKMVDEEAWLDVIPLLKWLTDTAVGQLWIHHTGYNKEHGFGTSTREWMMDTVALMTEVKRPDADISFTLEFLKARERTSENRGDFDNVTIALVNDEWTCSAAMNKPRKISPLGTKFLAALKDALASSNTTTFQRWRAVTLDQWWAECKVQNLIDGENPKTDSAMRSKYKKELIGANAIACNDKLVWLI
jgi:hypothetical protein